MKKSLLSFVTLAAIAVSSFLFSDNSLANAQILAEIDSDDEVSCFNEFVSLIRFLVVAILATAFPLQNLKLNYSIYYSIYIIDIRCLTGLTLIMLSMSLR